jgi:saccharopine dehydrogenase-like NADP-dependent oxidoreductase
VNELASLSATRTQLLQDVTVAQQEEEKKAAAFEDIGGTFAALASDVLQKSYLEELKTAFVKGRALEAELKAPKGDGGAE